jgi:hypothetical protein
MCRNSAQLKKIEMKENFQNLNRNSANEAKSKLSQHRSMGTKSNLTIFQVAHLMDTLKYSENDKNQLPSLFFSVGLN